MNNDIEQQQFDQNAWFAQVQERVSAMCRRFPVPEGFPAGTWQMLTMLAAHVPGPGFTLMCMEQGYIWTEKDRGPVRAGPQKQCFQNATRMVLKDASLTYVEGYGCTSKVGLAVHHAWVVDAKGRVLDPTWPDGVAYCGLPIAREALAEITAKSEYWGIFGNPRIPDWMAEDTSRWLLELPGARRAERTAD